MKQENKRKEGLRPQRVGIDLTLGLSDGINPLMGQTILYLRLGETIGQSVRTLGVDVRNSHGSITLTQSVRNGNPRLRILVSLLRLEFRTTIDFLLQFVPDFGIVKVNGGQGGKDGFQGALRRFGSLSRVFQNFF